MSVLPVADRLAIDELISLYGHIVDEREFSSLNKIFTDDAVFDLCGYGGQIYQGLQSIIDMMQASCEHPLAHHATNVVILDADMDSAMVKSKGLGVGHKGRVGSVVYRDLLVRIDHGWRISERLVELRGHKNSDTAL